MNIVEWALPLVLMLGGALIALEHLFPAHPVQPHREWYVRAALVNAMQLLVFAIVDRLWRHWGGGYSVFALGQKMPPFAGALLAYFIFTFVVYWWHRARHGSPLVWRIFHQLHHSPRRIETLTAYYIHPLDMVVVLFISNAIVYVLLGLGLEAAAWYTLITGSAGFLIHANLRLPRQVGYVFSTPEMHRLHHKSGHHAHNYADIVWWDMLFGTYLNPVEDIECCGFEDAAERHVIPMLLGKNIDES